MKSIFRLSVSVAALLSLAAVSCQKAQEQPELSTLQDALKTKVVKLNDNYLPLELLVKLESNQTDPSAVFASEGVLSYEKLFMHHQGKDELEAQYGLDRWYVLNLAPDADIDVLVETLAAQAQVSSVEYSSIATFIDGGEPHAADVTTKAAESNVYPFNDPQLNMQWHYLNLGSGAIASSCVKGADINVVDVWKNLCCGDPDIIVAVVDEGVCHEHPDLKANMWTNTKEIPNNGIDDDNNGYIDDVYGFNFVTNGPISWGQSGDTGHGTHCAGTIAAVNNNSIGVSGVAGGSGKGDGCRIMGCQIFSANKGGDAQSSSNAIKYAADHGASIISCSFGYTSPMLSDNIYKKVATAEYDAIRYFEGTKNNDVVDGGIAIFAAGNENQNFAHYPGALAEIISVSAFGPDFLPTYYTNYGPGCNIAAPGGEAYLAPWTSYNALVLSTLPKENSDNTWYGYMQGTSMACPHVSGIVALALSYAKKRGKHFTAQEFKNMILSSVNDIDQRIGSVAQKEYLGGRKSNPLKMAPYYHNVGTGAIDTWRLMMNIDGIPSSTATVGTKQWLDLSPYFGTASVSLTYLSLDVPQETIDALGLQKIKAANDANHPGFPSEGYAVIQFGRLYIHPTKVGSGKLTIKSVGGGSAVGGGDNPPGGMEVTREVSIVSRYANGNNGTGAWL